MDLLSLFIAWLVGVISGFFANVLHHKYVKWRKSKSKADYITSIWSEDTVRFEGQISGTVDMGEVARRVLGIEERRAVPDTYRT